MSLEILDFKSFRKRDDNKKSLTVKFAIHFDVILPRAALGKKL